MSVTLSKPSVLIPSDMPSAMRMAEVMAAGKLMPAHLQKSPGDCLMVIEQAMRWNMSPFAVAQATSVIQGKLMFEGKLVAAALHTSGALATRLDYTYTGSGDDRTVTVSAVRAGETEAKTVDVRLKDARTNNKVWQTQPDQQLAYHGARVWARRYAPEVMMGVYSKEEFSEAPEEAPKNEGAVVIDGVAEPTPTEPRRPTIKEWLDTLEADLTGAQDADAVDAITARPDVQKALDSLQNGARDRLNAMVKAALDRTAVAAEPGGEEVPF